MKDLNFDYLNKEDYLKYKEIMKTFFPDDYEERVIDFNFMKDPINHKVFEGINAVYSLKESDEKFILRLFKNYIFPFLASIITLENYNKIDPYSKKWMYSFYTFRSKFFNKTPLISEIVNEFYQIYPTYKLNKIIYNTNDKIILDYEEKGKIILAPFDCNFSAFSVFSLFKKFLQFTNIDNTFYKKTSKNFVLNYIVNSPFFFSVYRDFIDPVYKTMIGFVLVLPKTFNLYEYKKDSRPIVLNNFKISSYSSYFDEQDFVIYSYIDIDTNLGDLANKVANVIKEKLENNELRISTNEEIYCKKSKPYLMNNKNITINSYTNYLDLKHKKMEFYYQGRFYINNIKKIEKGAFFKYKTFFDGWTFNDYDLFLSFQNYCYLKNKEYELFEENINIKERYKKIFRKLKVGTVCTDENNPLKVTISLDKSLNNEHAINYIKHEFLLDNDNLEVTFNFIDSKFKG